MSERVGAETGSSPSKRRNSRLPSLGVHQLSVDEVEGSPTPTQNQMMSNRGRRKSSHRTTRRQSRQTSLQKDEDIPVDTGYKVIGILRTDLQEACAEVGITYVPEIRLLAGAAAIVPPTPSLPDTSQESTLNIAGKKKDKKGPVAGRGKAEKKISKEKDIKQAGKRSSVTLDLKGSFGTDPMPDLAQQKSPQPEGLVIANLPNREFFAPTLLTDSEVSTTTITIKGWRIDSPMWSVFQKVFPGQTRLSTLSLWRAGVDGAGVASLAQILPRCPVLTTLILDNNDLENAPVNRLILGKTCRLTYLSLRFCNMNDVSAAGIAGALWHLKEGNASLITLLLTGNKIGDPGARALADALKVNRTLLVLNLANNAIGDDGCTRLAEGLSWFPVEGPARAARKRLIKEDWDQRDERRRMSMSPRHRASIRRKSRKSLASVKVPAKKSSTHTKGKMSASAPPNSAKKSSSKEEDAKETPKDTNKAKSPPKEFFKPFRPSRFSDSDIKVAAWSSDHPLLAGGYMQGEYLWLEGNRSLIALNLLRNEIGGKGLKAMLRAVEDQQEEWQYRQDCRDLVDSTRKEREERRAASRRGSAGRGGSASRRLSGSRTALSREPSLSRNNTLSNPSTKGGRSKTGLNAGTPASGRSKTNLNTGMPRTGRSKTNMAAGKTPEININANKSQEASNLNEEVKRAILPLFNLIQPSDTLVQTNVGGGAPSEPTTLYEEFPIPDPPQEDPQRPGLLRLVIHMNAFNAKTSPDMQRLSEIMQLRDPITKFAKKVD